MKGSIFAAAAMVGSAMADAHLHRRHDALHQRRAESSSVAISSAAVSSSAAYSAALSAPAAAETCGCVTKVITHYGSPTLVPIVQTPIESTTTSTTTISATSTATSVVTITPTDTVTSSAVVPTTTTSSVELPTGAVTSFSETGTYTIPATTLTVTESTTVAAAATTSVAAGTYTLGQTTTVVETETTVICPYATALASGTTTTSVIEYTTYTCPGAGTYTVVPGTTTTVSTDTVLVYPTPATITPGTYTQPETTITVTKTDYTYVCPFATSSTLASTPAAVVPTTTAAAVVPTTAAAVETSVASTSTSSSSPSTYTDGALTGKDAYGMTFSPYTSSGDCMTEAEVLSNMKVIKEKGFGIVRVYSTDCSSLSFIGAAAETLSMKMILGVYIEKTGVSVAQEQVEAITSWAKWDLVDFIVVGNEAISMGYVSSTTLASFITSSKAAFKAAGYTGEVTTTEPIDIWQEYSTTLCDAVDFVGANLHPFFNADTTAEEAGTFLTSEFAALKKLCDKDIINLETGWPMNGNANGLAVPSAANQEIALKAIAKAVGTKSIFFSYANDAWKSPGAYDVEQYWGCADVFSSS